MRAALALSLAVGCAAPAAPAPDTRDLDSDGYPDAAQLSTEDDRRAFADAFAAVALAQAEKLEAAFEPSQRDCAGLVRYAYREALKPHGAEFAARHPGLPRLPEVRAFQYPNVPVLGTRLFRVAAGAFDGQLERAFAEAPEALRLAMGSARRVAGPPHKADLLLFRTDSGGAHLMIVASDEADPLLVYHTGPYDGTAGEVRRVRLSGLLEHPDPAWRPRPGNEAFAGYFRFKILGGR